MVITMNLFRCAFIILQDVKCVNWTNGMKRLASEEIHAEIMDDKLRYIHYL